MSGDGAEAVVLLALLVLPFVLVCQRNALYSYVALPPHHTHPTPGRWVEASPFSLELAFEQFREGSAAGLANAARQYRFLAVLGIRAGMDNAAFLLDAGVSSEEVDMTAVERDARTAAAAELSRTTGRLITVAEPVDWAQPLPRASDPVLTTFLWESPYMASVSPVTLVDELALQQQQEKEAEQRQQQRQWESEQQEQPVGAPFRHEDEEGMVAVDSQGEGGSVNEDSHPSTLHDATADTNDELHAPPLSPTPSDLLSTTASVGIAADGTQQGNLPSAYADTDTSPPASESSAAAAPAASSTSTAGAPAGRGALTPPSGVVVSPRLLSFLLYKSAAALGLPHAQHRMGDCFAEGWRGVPNCEHPEWNATGTDTGMNDAAALAHAAPDGTSSSSEHLPPAPLLPLRSTAALHWYRKAMGEHFSHSMFAVAQGHASGRLAGNPAAPVQRNLTAAWELLERAAATDPLGVWPVRLAQVHIVTSYVADVLWDAVRRSAGGALVGRYDDGGDGVRSEGAGTQPLSSLTSDVMWGCLREWPEPTPTPDAATAAAAAASTTQQQAGDAHTTMQRSAYSSSSAQQEEQQRRQQEEEEGGYNYGDIVGPLMGTPTPTPTTGVFPAPRVYPLGPARLTLEERELCSVVVRSYALALGVATAVLLAAVVLLLLPPPQAVAYVVPEAGGAALVLPAPVSAAVDGAGVVAAEAAAGNPPGEGSAVGAAAAAVAEGALAVPVTAESAAADAGGVPHSSGAPPGLTEDQPTSAALPPRAGTTAAVAPPPLAAPLASGTETERERAFRLLGDTREALREQIRAANRERAGAAAAARAAAAAATANIATRDGE